ncbi:MAG: response regulator [Thaumarchaeota archaeon]|nr:response regulator [Nitrososphaerota archaeon]
MAKRILIAEDNQDLTETYKNALENIGYAVTTARSGDECLQTYFDYLKNNNVSEPPLDVIILDQKMPGMDGIDVAREIQRLDPKQRIIFVTGYGTDVIKKLSDLKEKVEVMNKPFALKALISQIEGHASVRKERVTFTKTGTDCEMSANRQPSNKNGSAEQSRTQLLTRAKEPDEIAGQFQSSEPSKTNSGQLLDYVQCGKADNRIRMEGAVPHGSTTIKKVVQKINAGVTLKVELIALAVLAILFFYAIDNYYQPDQIGTLGIKTKYSIEDLQGQTSATQHWNVAKGTPLTVNIVNLSNLSQEKINNIKKAILSTDVLYTGSSFLDGITSDKKSEYFKGWKGALDTINNTEFYVPNQFNIADSSDNSGQIVIFLSNGKDPDGYSAYTKLIVGNSQILKSFITIYGADKLSDSQLTAITVHEFGHALGLSNSNGPQNMVQDTVQTNHPYISECDVNAIQSLYNGGAQNNWFCNT